MDSLVRTVQSISMSARPSHAYVASVMMMSTRTHVDVLMATLDCTVKPRSTNAAQILVKTDSAMIDLIHTCAFAILDSPVFTVLRILMSAVLIRASHLGSA